MGEYVWVVHGGEVCGYGGGGAGCVDVYVWDGWRIREGMACGECVCFSRCVAKVCDI